MRHLLVCLALAGLAGPVAACINDAELPSHEREFRSRYLNPGSRPATPYPAPEKNQTAPRLLLGSGLVLLTGAVALASRRREQE